MSTDNLKVLIRKVAELRRDINTMQSLKILAMEEVVNTPQHKNLLKVEGDMDVVAENLTTAQEELKSAVLAVYDETGEKKPIEKVEVKIHTKLIYVSEKVLAWCRTLAPYLLVLDKKAFETKAEDLKEAGAPVEIEKEARCNIATDLSQYLERK